MAAQPKILSCCADGRLSWNDEYHRLSVESNRLSPQQPTSTDAAKILIPGTIWSTS